MMRQERSEKEKRLTNNETGTERERKETDKH